VVDVARMEPVERIAVGEGPCKVAVNPRSGTAFIANSLDSTIVRVRLDDRSVIDEVPVERAPVGVAEAPAGDRFYVCNRGAGSISIVGADDGREWARVPVGKGPGDLAVDPVTGWVLVSNAGSASLIVVEDLLTGPSADDVTSAPHPLTGQRVPAFRLPDLEGRIRESREWAEKKYILNFFASW